MSRMYRIDQNTGVVTAVGSAGAFAIVGTSFDMDFNPTVDRIRFVSDSDQNLRLNPNDGTLSAQDGTLRYAMTDPNAAVNANVIASAYRNNFAGAAVTTLFGIDTRTDALVTQDPPNEGILNTVGSLGVDASDADAGFDISPSTGVAFAALNVGGTPNLYTVNLRTGAVAPSTGGTSSAIIAPGSRGTATVVSIAALGVPGNRLRNVSTRGRVTSGENILIAGFISRGAGPTGNSGRFIIRAIGPSLANFGVTEPLQDPVLTIYDSNRNVIVTNDNFGSAADAAAIAAVGLAPTSANESAVLLTLAPGAYTAHVTANGAGGIGLVEIYELP
jgi:hypothetical protein